MPTPSQVTPIMEGMVGYLANSAAGDMAPAIWVESMKLILRNFGRDESDWQFLLVDNVLSTGIVVDAAATNVSGLLVGQDSSEAERDWVAIVDNDTGTFVGDSILPNDNLLVFQPAAAATNDVEEYTGLAFIPWIVLATGYSVAADGRDGTAPAANDLRAWTLFRT